MDYYAPSVPTRICGRDIPTGAHCGGFFLAAAAAAAPDKQIKNDRVGPPRAGGDGNGREENASIIIRFQCAGIFFAARRAINQRALHNARPSTAENKGRVSGTNCARRVR